MPKKTQCCEIHEMFGHSKPAAATRFCAIQKTVTVDGKKTSIPWLNFMACEECVPLIDQADVERLFLLKMVSVLAQKTSSNFLIDLLADAFAKANDNQ